jgi:uncharacterized protein (TIGR02452 family)
MPRDVAARLGAETVEILRARGYTAPSGNRVDLADRLERAVRGTESYPPDREVPRGVAARHRTAITVENATVLEVARRLAGAGRVVALNFASAVSPGGGFLHGALAQEEAIARSSGLYACLEGNPMYEYHRARLDAMYSDYVLYSPDVPVIRTDGGDLFEEPYPCSILTSPAPFTQALAHYEPHRLPEIEAAFRSRIAKVLSVGAAHGHDTIILGAWGCGAFGGDPGMVARLFHESLSGPFSGVYREVVFSITDWSEEKRFIGPFELRCGLDGKEDVAGAKRCQSRQSSRDGGRPRRLRLAIAARLDVYPLGRPH